MMNHAVELTTTEANQSKYSKVSTNVGVPQRRDVDSKYLRYIATNVPFLPGAVVGCLVWTFLLFLFIWINSVQIF